MIKFSSLRQSLVSVVVVLLLSVLCHSLREYVDYRIVALILLLAVSVLAVLFDILPVLLAAVLSALILNLFFIEPVLNYKIRGAENVLLFFIFILVALVNAVLTNRLRKQEAKVRDKEEKEKTISLYNTLLSSLSHELKTPISTIIGAVDTLKDSGDKMTRDQRVDLYLEMEIAVNRLNKQVENLLNMSRLESGILKLKANWQDVNELIYSLLRKVPNQEKHKIVFIEDEKMPLFKLDIGLLETALYCVVENAVRYTPDGTEIKIFTAYEDEFLEIGISDNGKGIPEQEMGLVFNKFYRRANSGSGGTGLGLSIAKGLIEAHNGNISLRKSIEGGAEFLIRIPTEVSYLKNLKNE